MRPHLVLFFTRGVSLRTWSMVGMLEREIAVYLRLMEQGFDVSFVTYGTSTDTEFADRLGGIRILCNDRGLPPETYENSLEEVHACYLESSHVIKTNQTNGAEIALRAARRFGKPLVARCGYMWSHNVSRESGTDSLETSRASGIEETVFHAAAKVVVTTEIMRMDVASRMPAAGPKTVVIPNYVDTETFRPMNAVRDRDTILYVGRISAEKNLQSLLQAVRELPVRLIVIGEGKLRPELQASTDSFDGKVTWEGNVPNSNLPDYMNRAGMFVLPSFYEGHPKALAEAMACGLPVIGANSVGIREMIEHGETGYLCSTDTDSIRSAIEHLLSDPDLFDRLAVNARNYVEANYSLKKICKLEAALLREVAEG